MDYDNWKAGGLTGGLNQPNAVEKCWNCYGDICDGDEFYQIPIPIGRALTSQPWCVSCIDDCKEVAERMTE